MRCWRGCASWSGRGGVVYVSTPNVLTLAPAGEPRSGNPWHVREYRPDEYRALCERHFGRVELLGLFHARKLRLHQLRDRARGLGRGAPAPADSRARSTTASRPAISDARLRAAPRRLERALDLLAVLGVRGASG